MFQFDKCQSADCSILLLAFNSTFCLAFDTILSLANRPDRYHHIDDLTLWVTRTWAKSSIAVNRVAKTESSSPIKSLLLMVALQNGMSR